MTQRYAKMDIANQNRLIKAIEKVADAIEYLIDRLKREEEEEKKDG